VRSLDNGFNRNIKISPTTAHLERFKPKLTLDQVLKIVYQIPESQAQPSIDSFILTPENLILFQITRSTDHPIGANGLIELFKNLNMINEIRMNPAFVMILFVVPKGVGSSFVKQDIMNPLENFAVDDLKTCECTIIPGIKQAKKRRLDEIGINSCHALIEACNRNDERISFVMKNTRKFIDDLAILSNLKFLAQIPLYVLEVDYSES
jgi:hypothetical protein